MKKLFVALVLVAALCLIAVSPAVADPNKNWANQGINTTSPFWFKDYVTSGGKTLENAFNRTVFPNNGSVNLGSYTTSSGKTLENAFKIPAYTTSSGKTLENAFIRPAYVCSSCRSPI